MVVSTKTWRCPAARSRVARSSGRLGEVEPAPAGPRSRKARLFLGGTPRRSSRHGNVDVVRHHLRRACRRRPAGSRRAGSACRRSSGAQRLAQRGRVERAGQLEDELDEIRVGAGVVVRRVEVQALLERGQRQHVGEAGASGNASPSRSDLALRGPTSGQVGRGRPPASAAGAARWPNQRRSQVRRVRASSSRRPAQDQVAVSRGPSGWSTVTALSSSGVPQRHAGSTRRTRGRARPGSSPARRPPSNRPR